MFLIRHRREQGFPQACEYGMINMRIITMANQKIPYVWRKRPDMKKTLFLLVLVLSALLCACASVQNPCTQEYLPGQGNIIGTLDPDYFDSVSPDFAIGATAEGVPVFKDPHRAFRTLKKLYAEDIRLIAQENDLPPLSQKTYMSYRDMGHQMEGATAGSRFVSAVLDIYKNSFIDLSWSACATSPTDLEEGQEQQDPSAEGIGVYLGTGGGIARYRPLTDDDLTGDVSPAGLIFEENPEAWLPVFANPYPVGQGAAKYDVTNEMQQAMEQRLVSFMELLDGEYDPEKYPVFYEEAEDYATRSAMIPHIRISKDVFISSNPRNMYVQMESGGEEIARLLPDGDLRQNPLLAAVLDYMGIDDPQVEYMVQYLLGSGRYEEYTIYQKTDDCCMAARNRAFNAVRVYCSNGFWEHAAIYFDKQDYLPVNYQMTIITRGQALDVLQKIIPDLDREAVKARVGYSREIREEYFIPCWELYVPTEYKAADGTVLYAFLLVPVLDPDSLE